MATATASDNCLIDRAHEAGRHAHVAVLRLDCHAVTRLGRVGHASADVLAAAAFGINYFIQWLGTRLYNYFEDRTHMTILVRTLIGLIALFFIAWGLRFFFTPDAMAAEFGIVPSGVAGLSTVRGDLGGAFLGIGLLAAMGLRRGARHWLYAAAGLIGAIALGRAIGFAFDGAPQAVVIPFSTELAFIAALVYAARRLRSEEDKQ